MTTTASSWKSGNLILSSPCPQSYALSVPGHTYGSLRLKESVDLVPDEALVQRLWFESLFLNPLTTTSGQKLLLIQPGFWNHGAGPDFLNAAIQLSNHAVRSGPVEIHLTPDGFKSHGHHRDPAYANLLLHAVWIRGLSAPPPLLQDGSPVPVVELSSQLSIPLGDAKACFSSLPSEVDVGARIGRCQNALHTLPEPVLLRLIEEAGWFRFHQRVTRWRLKAQQGNLPDLLWQGLAEVLGYSGNRETMTSLSRSLPISLLKQQSAIQREALLFGVAGWMTAPASPSLSSHIRSLWDVWWKVRDDFDPIPLSSWNLSGTRPLNRPERRLAALSVLSDPTRFNRLMNSITQADTETALSLLIECSHPEWNHRFSLLGKYSPKKHRLVGNDRAHAFLFNVFWPLAYAYRPDQVENSLRSTLCATDSLASRRTRVRLFKTPRSPSLPNRLLVTEGLLQIYRDFCLTDRSSCQHCEFPEWINQWKNS